MAYTGTNKTETKIKNLTINNLSLKENSIPVDIGVNITESIISQFQFLTNEINALKEQLNNVTISSQTGAIQAFAGPAIDEETATILPPPPNYERCFGQIVSKTNEKYANLYSIIGDYWNTDDNLTEDQFQIPDLRNTFLRGCPEYIIGSENNRRIGNFQTCGLPNSKGILTHSGAVFEGNCPFYYISEKTRYTGHTDYESIWKVGFDLSRSSSVYQDGLTEVRPDNKAVNYIIKL